MKDILRFICLSKDLDFFFVTPDAIDSPAAETASDWTEDAELAASESETELEQETDLWWLAPDTAAAPPAGRLQRRRLPRRTPSRGNGAVRESREERETL